MLGCKGTGTNHIADFQHVLLAFLARVLWNALQVLYLCVFLEKIFEKQGYKGYPSLNKESIAEYACQSVPKVRIATVSSLSGFSGHQACKPTERCM